MIASLDSGDAKSIERYLDDESPVTMSSVCSVCDGPETSTVTHTRESFITFVKGAERRMEEGPYTHHRPHFLFCEAGCCSGPTGMLSHTAQFITSVCFRDEQTPKLVSIDLVDGG